MSTRPEGTERRYSWTSGKAETAVVALALRFLFSSEKARTAAITRVSRGASRSLILGGADFRWSLFSLLMSNRPTTLPVRTKKAAAIAARLARLPMGRLSRAIVIKRTKVLIKFKTTTAGEGFFRRRKNWRREMARKRRRICQLAEARMIWAKRRKRKICFKRDLVFLSCFWASMMAKGEMRRTATRTRV